MANNWEYIGDDTLRRLPGERSRKRQVDTLPTIKVMGDHTYKVGEQYEEGKDFKKEKMHVDPDGNPAVFITVGWVYVAVPIVKEEKKPENLAEVSSTIKDLAAVLLPKIRAHQLSKKFEQWCKETNRNSSVITGKSLQEFFQWFERNNVESADQLAEEILVRPDDETQSMEQLAEEVLKEKIIQKCEDSKSILSRWEEWKGYDFSKAIVAAMVEMHKRDKQDVSDINVGDIQSLFTRLSKMGEYYRFENGEEGYYLSIINRQVYPRLWSDNFQEGNTTIISESTANIINRTVLAEKDWEVRFFGEKIEELCSKVNIWLNEKALNQNK